MRLFTRPALALTVAAALWSTTALAQATEEGAVRLTAVMQTYLGTTEGVVTVTPEGAAYKLRLDVAPLIAAIPAEGVTAEVSPLDFTVTDNGDGTWAYVLDQPVSLAWSVPEMVTAKASYGQVKVSGVFDQALGDSREYHVEMLDAVTEQTQSDPTMGDVVVRSSIASTTIDGTAEAAGTGVNGKFTSTGAGMSYEMTMPGGEGMPGMSFTGTVAEATADGALTGYRPAALYGLVAYFVAHPSEEMIEADLPGLKSVLEGALPIFENLTMTGAYKTITIQTPMGEAGIDEVGLDFDLNGLVSDGKLREAISLKGLRLPEGLVPPFAAPLVPTDLSLDFTVAGFDAGAAARLGLTLLDQTPGNPPPEGFEEAMLAALLPDGTVDITIAPGATDAPAYHLTYEAAMAVGPMTPMPVGTARIGLTGMEAITAALMASPPEMGMQEMAPMLGMAEMMAQPGAEGELVWEIEATATGGLLVNGQDMMGGGQ